MKKKLDDKICLSCKYHGLNMPIKLRICMLDRMYKGECKKRKKISSNNE